MSRVEKIVAKMGQAATSRPDGSVVGPRVGRAMADWMECLNTLSTSVDGL